MNVPSLLAIGVAGMLGCWLRWALSLAFNPLLPHLPLGTLAANLLGGLLMGLVLAALEQFPALPLPLRLALTTGFLGGLTTFSTFSAESVGLLLRQQYLWFGGNVLVNLVGSLTMTLLGLFAMRALFRLASH